MVEVHDEVYNESGYVMANVYWLKLRILKMKEVSLQVYNSIRQYMSLKIRSSVILRKYKIKYNANRRKYRFGLVSKIIYQNFIIYVFVIFILFNVIIHSIK